MLGTTLASFAVVTSPDVELWRSERDALLGRRIAELGLAIGGTRVEQLVVQLYAELEARGLAYRPPVYLSDEWGCPDGTPAIGVPFYLADARLERIELEHAGSVEGDDEAMRYLRHEAGHAFNYAFRLHEHPEFRSVFGDYARAYDDTYALDPLSRDHVRHILGWYAQKHPDEDFAETFAVWLTPSRDWRVEYDGWGALGKLAWVDARMRDLAHATVPAPQLTEEDVPLEAMRWTVAEHYADDDASLFMAHGAQFDSDLRRIFADATAAPAGESASYWIARHEGELVTRIGYWSGSGTPVVRGLLRALERRCDALALRVAGLESATLIELTTFAMAVMMHWRYGALVRGRGT